MGHCRGKKKWLSQDLIETLQREEKTTAQPGLNEYFAEGGKTTALSRQGILCRGRKKQQFMK